MSLSSPSPSISIVIPTYNRVRWLGPTLESVFRLTVPADTTLEVLVIDNNCTDGTDELVKAKARTSPWALRHIVETQQGLCFGRNRGLQEAVGEHVAFLDDDIRIAPEWVVGFLDAIRSRDADCVVGPVNPIFDGPVPNFMTPRVVDSIGSYYSRKGESTQVLAPEYAHQVPGCNFGVRRSVAEEIGGFDHRLDRVGRGLLAGGDTEFGLRLARAGKRVVYEPRCAIDHLLVSEKMTKRYMRRRWIGLGATQRAIRPDPGFSWMKQTLRISERLMSSLLLRIRGRSSLAFQRELEALRMWGYMRGRCLIEGPDSAESGAATGRPNVVT